MHIELRTPKGTRGEIRLVGGRAKGSDPFVETVMAGLNVVEPGTLQPLGPESGQRYLDALPNNLNGTYFWAAKVDD